MIIDFDWLTLLYLLSWFIVIFYIRCNLLTCQHSLFTYGFFASDMHELQARIREKDERMAELMTLREELEAERRRAEELRLEMERSHEMEQSERQRLVCRLAAQFVNRANYRPFLNYNNCWCHCICDSPPPSLHIQSYAENVLYNSDLLGVFKKDTQCAIYYQRLF